MYAISTNSNFQLVSRAKIQYACDSKRPDLMLLLTNIGNEFQTIYSINYGGSEHSRPLLDENFEKFIAPLQYIENFQSPPLMPENNSVPPP